MNPEIQQETNQDIYRFGISNDRLIKKIFGSYLLASIVSSIVAAIGPIVDGIVALARNNGKIQLHNYENGQNPKLIPPNADDELQQ